MRTQKVMILCCNICVLREWVCFCYACDEIWVPGGEKRMTTNVGTRHSAQGTKPPRPQIAPHEMSPWFRLVNLSTSLHSILLFLIIISVKTRLDEVVTRTHARCLTCSTPACHTSHINLSESKRPQLSHKSHAVRLNMPVPYLAREVFEFNFLI